MNLWQLPQKAILSGKCYPFYADYRDILQIIGYLGDEKLPVSFRWEIALQLYYKRPVAPAHKQAAMAYLGRFLCRDQEDVPAPKLICWRQDADAIIADINRISGREIRSEEFVHWWTFLSWFDSIGPGQLSQRLSIRQKLRRGEKLTPEEREFYRLNRKKIRLSEPDPQKEKLEAMLAGKDSGNGH